MASMKEIREHIASIQSTQKVTNAMYLIASTKMRRAKEDLAKTRPFFDAVSTQIVQRKSIGFPSSCSVPLSLRVSNAASVCRSCLQVGWPFLLTVHF